MVTLTGRRGLGYGAVAVFTINSLRRSLALARVEKRDDLPTGAGLDALLIEASSLTAAACPLPVEFAVNDPGAEAGGAAPSGSHPNSAR